jgi:hypothetical protein
MATFNLDSPTGIRAPVDLINLHCWLTAELGSIAKTPVGQVIELVIDNLDDFVQFPSRALLLWDGCDRIRPEGKRHKYHKYPDEIRATAKAQEVTLDSRPNGPAIAAFLLAGGRRPQRLGSSNAWSVHHLYSGKFPYLGRDQTTHAAKLGRHFTQSAGLIAAQPIADAICDEFPCFSWFLRAEAFVRFGYDPDGVFSDKPDDYGFAAGFRPSIIHRYTGS